MKIGMLGTGEVGRSLGNACMAEGHDVLMGARSAGNEKAVAWAKAAGKGAFEGSFADAAQFGDMIVLATLGTANESALRAAGIDALANKVLIDTTNPLDFSSGKPMLAVGHTDSGGEQVQRLLPRTQVVKAFNTVGNKLMYKPNLPGGPPDMPICGNDEGAKDQVTKLLKDFGWEVIDLGGIESSRYLEPMCMAWVMYGLRSKGWNHAWKLLR